MISSGLSLVRALAVLTDQIDSKPLRNTMTTVRSEVEQGSSLSGALEKHPKVFGPLYIAMIRAGEAGGQLDEVLFESHLPLVPIGSPAESDDLRGREFVQRDELIPLLTDFDLGLGLLPAHRRERRFLRIICSRQSDLA